MYSRPATHGTHQYADLPGMLKHILVSLALLTAAVFAITPARMTERQCTINHVYFEDVCEDAITIKQASGVSYINYGGAKGASDKIVQHNGGGKVVINSFYAENFGKVYRSCGNCKTQFKRSVEINDSWAVSGSTLVGINTNFGDTATIRRQRASNVKAICEKFIGNNLGNEPTKNGSGPDNVNCLYNNYDVTS
ncbi:hypothetical protein H1R20_g2316, partial [Candolleomyces eurysporus]